MGLLFVKLDENKLSGYQYYGHKYDGLEKGVGRNLTKVFSIFRFENLDGYKPLCIKQNYNVKTSSNNAMRENRLKHYTDKKVLQKVDEAFSMGDKVKFNKLIAFSNCYNGMVANDIVAESIVCTEKSKTVMNELPISTTKTPLSEFINYINVSDLPIDYQGTFGELRFRGLNNIVYKRDENDELTNEIESMRYNVFSTAQGCSFNVIINSVDVLDIEFNSIVELENCFIDNFVFPRTNNHGFRVYAGNIIAKNQPKKEVKENIK